MCQLSTNGWRLCETGKRLAKAHTDAAYLARERGTIQDQINYGRALEAVVLHARLSQYTAPMANFFSTPGIIFDPEQHDLSHYVRGDEFHGTLQRPEIVHEDSLV